MAMGMSTDQYAAAAPLQHLPGFRQVPAMAVAIELVS